MQERSFQHKILNIRTQKVLHKHKQQIDTYLLNDVVQATNYGRLTFHPILGTIPST